MKVIISDGDSAELKSLAAQIQQIEILDTVSKTVNFVNNITNEIVLTLEFNVCTLGNDCRSNDGCATYDDNWQKVRACPREKSCEKYSRKIWERKRGEALRYPEKYPKTSPYSSK